MPLPVPQLDDRDFEQLATEARSLIPKYLPDWTDHNPSDPGITVLELFAFLFEAAIYQNNRVPERSLEQFAALVGVQHQPGARIEETLGQAINAAHASERAITSDEFAAWAIEAAPSDSVSRSQTVTEAVALPALQVNAPTIKVVIVPSHPDDPAAPVPTTALRQAVYEGLRQRCLITTRLQVMGPDYTDVSIAIRVVYDVNSRLDRAGVQQQVTQTIKDFLNPLHGGKDGTGWVFGRPVFRSELYQQVEGIAGVDHVQRLWLNSDDAVRNIPLVSAISLVRLQTVDVTLVDI